MGLKEIQEMQKYNHIDTQAALRDAMAMTHAALRKAVPARRFRGDTSNRIG